MPDQQLIELPEDSPDLLRVVECMKDYLTKHGERSKSFEVLGVLTDMTVERLSQGKDAKLTAFNLRLGVVGDAAEDRTSSGWLSNIWNALETKMVNREQGLQQFAAQRGLDFYPWPEKDKSNGGAGNTSYYFLKAKAINKHVIEDTDLKPLKPDQIRYIRELTPTPAWWAKGLLLRGYALQGWRKWLFIAYGLSVVLLIGAIILAAWFLVGY